MLGSESAIDGAAADKGVRIMLDDREGSNNVAMVLDG